MTAILPRNPSETGKTIPVMATARTGLLFETNTSATAGNGRSTSSAIRMLSTSRRRSDPQSFRTLTSAAAAPTNTMNTSSGTTLMMLLMGGVAAAAAGFLSSRGGGGGQLEQVEVVSSRTKASSGEEAAATTLYKDASVREEADTDEDEPAEKVDTDTVENDEDEDPYANLPEEDEDTDCTMCQTFRQGPCRPFWRKLERCFKDNESSSDGGDENSSAASNCVRYFTPHQNCLSNYTNLYQLISLDLKQELVNDVVEPAVSPGERRPFLASDVAVDWTRWRQFYAEMGPSFRQTVNHHRTTEPATTPLWKRLPSSSSSSSSAGTNNNNEPAAMVEPVLILTKATLPVRPPTVDAKKNAADSSSNHHHNMLLKIAYAIDQDGFVIGLSYNSHYGELMEQAKKLQQPNNKDGGSVNHADKDSQSAAKEETTAANNDTTKSPADASSTATTTGTKTTSYDLDFYILPGECRTVRICALYAEDPLTVADSDKEILDVLLYKSKFLSLEEQIDIAVDEGVGAQSQITRSNA